MRAADVASKTIAISSKPGICNETVDAVGGDGHTHARRARQPVRLGIDADECAHLEVRGGPQDLDHQIRADVAAPDNGDFYAHHCDGLAASYGYARVRRNTSIVSTLKSHVRLSTRPRFLVSRLEMRRSVYTSIALVCQCGRCYTRVRRLQPARGICLTTSVRAPKATALARPAARHPSAREGKRKTRDMTWTVYSSLRESILNGALPPGESLSQVQLASQLGVSRGPLREAVRMLQREGLVEAEVNRRGRVSSFSIDDLEQLYAMRIVHESLAIRINVPRFTKRDIDALRGCLRRMEALAGHDLRQWQAVDREFHFTLLAHAGDRLLRTIRELYDHADRYRWLYIKGVPRALSIAADEHKAIFDACVERRCRAGGGAAGAPSRSNRPHRAHPSRAGARSDDRACCHPPGDRRRGRTGGQRATAFRPRRASTSAR